MKDQVNMFSPKPISPVKIFLSENYLDELQDTEFKRTLKIFIKELKGLKEDTQKQFSEIKEKEPECSTCKNDAQENKDDGNGEDNARLGNGIHSCLIPFSDEV